MALDISKLEKAVAAPGGGYTARCPVCARNGADKTGNHLRIFPNSAYSCAVAAGSATHNAEIYALAGTHGSGFVDAAPPVEPAHTPVEMPKSWSLSVLDRLVGDVSYWEGRGISGEVARSFRIGVATDGQMKDRSVIPIFSDDESVVVGFTGRALKPYMTAKYKHLGTKDEWVWGGIDAIESSRRAILVESPADAMMLATHGVDDVLCLFGVSMSQAVLAKLVALNPHTIIISTNRDAKHTVGQDAAAKIERKLSRFFSEGTATVQLPPIGAGKDWAECGRSQIRAAFCGEPEMVIEPAAAQPSDSLSPDTDADPLAIFGM